MGMPIIQDARQGISSNLLIYGSLNSGKTYTLIGSQASLFSLRQNLVSIDSGLSIRMMHELFNELVEIKIQLIDNEQIEIVFQHSSFQYWNQLIGQIIDPLDKLMKETGHIIIELRTKFNSKIRLIQIGSIYKNNQMSMLTHNKSIFTLHRCLTCLIELQKSKKVQNQKTYIPFRESKLTNMLSDSFQGQAELKILLCLSPTNYDEAISTLLFGQQFQQIQIKPQYKAEIMKQQSLMEQSQLLLSQSVHTVQQESIPLTIHRQKMQEMIDKYESIIEYLQEKLIKLQK